MTLWQKIKLLTGLNKAYTTALGKAKDQSMGKSIFASKTFWFNMALEVLGLVQQMGFINTLPEPYGPALVQAIGGVNMVLRYVTTQPVVLGVK